MKTTNTTNQVLKHNDGKVYFPIAKITVEVAKSNASSKGTRVQRYVLFEATTERFMTITSKNLRTALAENYDIRGFASSNLKMASYFINVRALNEAVDQKEQGEDIQERWLVYKKEIRNLTGYYYIVSESGEKRVIESKDFQAFCDNHVMIGVKRGINRHGEMTWMIQSQIIQSVNNSLDDISIMNLKKLKSPEEVLAEILTEEEEEPDS